MTQSVKLDIQIDGRFLTQPITGVQRYSTELVHALDRILQDQPNASIELLIPSDAPAPTLLNIRVTRVGRAAGHIWEQAELPFGQRPASILFCPGNMAPLSSLLTSKVVTTVHDLSFMYFPDSYSKSYRAFYAFMTPFIYRYSKKIITVSNSECESMANLYSKFADKIVPIQNGGGFRGPTQSSEIRMGNSILYVGSLSKRKNFDRLLDVAAQINRDFDTEFLIVGSVPRGLVGGLSARQLKGIRLLGQINDESLLRKLYASATCFFFPSLYEASPLPPIEAMSFGCPVVTSRIPSLVERCGDAAEYFDPEDINSMRLALERVLRDESLQADLRRRGLDRKNRFTWNNCAASTLEVLRDAADL